MAELSYVYVLSVRVLLNVVDSVTRFVPPKLGVTEGKLYCENRKTFMSF